MISCSKCGGGGDGKMDRVLVIALVVGALVGCCCYSSHGSVYVEYLYNKSVYLLCGTGLKRIYGEVVTVDECNDIKERSHLFKSPMDDYNDADHIIDNIYLGNVCAAHNITWLKEKDVGAVINMAVEWTERNISYVGVEFFSFILEDRTCIDRDLTERHINYATRILLSLVERGQSSTGEQSLGNVLVHCNMGISRSSSVVIRYLQIKHNMSYDEAYQYVKKKRPVTQPNRLFESILRGESEDDEKDRRERRKREWRAKKELEHSSL